MEAEMADVALKLLSGTGHGLSAESWSPNGWFLSLIISEFSCYRPCSSFKDTVNRVRLLI